MDDNVLQAAVKAAGGMVDMPGTAPVRVGSTEVTFLPHYTKDGSLILANTPGTYIAPCSSRNFAIVIREEVSYCHHRQAKFAVLGCQ